MDWPMQIPPIILYLPTSDHQRKKLASDPLHLLRSTLSQNTIQAENILISNYRKVEQSPSTESLLYKIQIYEIQNNAIY